MTQLADVRSRFDWFRPSTALRRCAALAALLAAFAARPSSASAQGWLENLQDAEGPGIRLGDFELHPGVGVEVGWDSNVFYSDQDPTASGILRITPHMILSTLGEDREGEGDRAGTPPPVRFRTGIFASYYEYFEPNAPDNLGVGGDIDLTINPERPFSFDLGGTYRRSIEPFTEFGPPGNEFGRHSGNVNATARLQTTGGALTGSLGYRLGFDLFEGEQFQYTNNVRHSPTAEFAWKFLPQSALIYDANYTYTDFFNTGASPEGASRLVDSSMYRTRVGFNGFLTRTFSITAMAGYAATFFNGDTLFDESDTFVAKLDLRLETAPGTVFSAGYERDLQVSYIGGYFQVDRGLVSVSTLVAGRVLVRVNGSIGRMDFGPLVGADGNPLGVDGTSDRTDLRLLANLFIEYRLLDWLGINGSVRYSSTLTDFEFTRDLGDPVPVVDPAEFQKVQLWLGVRVFY